MVFCDKSSEMKIEKEEPLRLLLNDKTSSYAVLLEKSISTTLRVRRIKAIACEVFKSLNDYNSSFMKGMFEKKEVQYELSDSQILYHLIFKKIAFGKTCLNIISNLIFNDLKNSTNIGLFKALIKTWEGSICQCLMCCALL